MCDVLDRVENKGKIEGRAEGKIEGRAEGKIEGKIEAYLEMGFSVQEIAQKIRISEDEVRQIIALLEK